MKNKLSSILLVDDDSISNYITEELIRDQNICPHVTVVTDGRQAILYLQEILQAPTSAQTAPALLVLLDLNMPVMDGFEFMEELEALQLHRQVVVVVLTSSDNQKDILKASKLSFAGYLQKPAAIEDIKKVISTHFS